MPPRSYNSAIVASTIREILTSHEWAPNAIDFALEVANRESSMGGNLVGDGGNSLGIWQFNTGGHLPLYRGWLARNGFPPDPRATNVVYTTLYLADHIERTGDWTPWTEARNLAREIGGFVRPDGSVVTAQGVQGPYDVFYGETGTGQEFPWSSSQAAQEMQGAQDLQRLRESLAVDRERIAAEKEEGRLNRAQEAQLATLARENALKMSRLQEAGAIARNMAGLRQRASELLTDLMGRDPFRAAAVATGAVPMGRTPAQAYAQRLQRVATAPPEPFLSATGSIAETERGLQQLGGLQEYYSGLMQPPQFGLAGGGEFDRDDGRPARFLVGEVGPEVLEFDDERVRVLPLTGRAQGGLEALRSFAGASPEELRAIQGIYDERQRPLGDARTALQDLSNIFGFSAPVTTTESRAFRPGQDPFRGYPLFPTGGYPTPAPAYSAELANLLGYRPRLLRTVEPGSPEGALIGPGVGNLFFVQPNGEVQYIGPGNADIGALGFNTPADFFTLGGASELGQLMQSQGLTFGGGSALPQPFSGAAFGAEAEQVGRFPAPGVPLRARLAPGVEAFIPAARQLANRWRFLDSSTQAFLLSAIGIAGGTPESFAQEMTAFTPRGSARGTGGFALG